MDEQQPASVANQEPFAVAAEQPTTTKKAGGLAKPPGAARKLRAPPSSNLHMLRGIREKLQNNNTHVEATTQAA